MPGRRLGRGWTAHSALRAPPSPSPQRPACQPWNRSRLRGITSCSLILARAGQPSLFAIPSEPAGPQAFPRRPGPLRPALPSPRGVISTRPWRQNNHQPPHKVCSHLWAEGRPGAALPCGGRAAARGLTRPGGHSAHSARGLGGNRRAWHQDTAGPAAGIRDGTHRAELAKEPFELQQVWPSFSLFNPPLRRAVPRAPGRAVGHTRRPLP